mgnify:CR=1 FL=1
MIGLGTIINVSLIIIGGLLGLLFGGRLNRRFQETLLKSQGLCLLFVGMGGAMDLCVGAKHCIVCMEHTAKGNPKIFEKCRLPLTASHCVNKIITEMCVLEVTPEGLLMTEINPEFTVEQVQAATAAPITVSENLKSMID